MAAGAAVLGELVQTVTLHPVNGARQRARDRAEHGHLHAKHAILAAICTGPCPSGVA